MRYASAIAFVACLAIAGVVHAAVIEVTVEADKDTINIGETGTFTVYGQVLPGYVTTNNGIIGWDVDLRIGNPDFLEILADTLTFPSAWTGTDMSSSKGTPTSWGLDAIFNEGFSPMDIGLTDPVELFSVDYRGISQGITTLAIEYDDTIGTDFITQNADQGGDYSQATSGGIEVVPEPTTLGLLGLGGLLLIRRLRG